MGWECGTYGEKGNTYGVLVGKPEEREHWENLEQREHWENLEQREHWENLEERERWENLKKENAGKT